jgi:hypothetical protein
MESKICMKEIIIKKTNKGKTFKMVSEINNNAESMESLMFLK